MRFFTTTQYEAHVVRCIDTLIYWKKSKCTEVDSDILSLTVNEIHYSVLWDLYLEVWAMGDKYKECDRYKWMWGITWNRTIIMFEPRRRRKTIQKATDNPTCGLGVTDIGSSEKTKNGMDEKKYIMCRLARRWEASMVIKENIHLVCRRDAKHELLQSTYLQLVRRSPWAILLTGVLKNEDISVCGAASSIPSGPWNACYNTILRRRWPTIRKTMVKSMCLRVDSVWQMLGAPRRWKKGCMGVDG